MPMPERTPPHSLDAERSVLGSAMQSDAALLTILGALTRDDFYAKAHAELFDAMQTLHAGGSGVDVVTLADVLKSRGLLQQIGGAEYLTSLPYHAPSPSGAVHYARIVKDKSLLRRLAAESYKAYERAYAGADPADDILRDAEDAVLSVAKDRAAGAGDVPAPARLAERFRAQLNERIESVPLPYEELNGMTAGLMPGSLFTIAGRTSAGKSAMALEIAKAASGKRKTLYISLEMPPEELLARYVASETGIAQRDIMRHRIPEDGADDLDGALSRYAAGKLYFTSAGRHVRDIGRVVAAHRPEVLIIDTVNLVKSAGETERVKILNVTRELKQLAIAERIPIVILAQLSRGTDQKASPTLSDIKESASIEEDSDVVMLLSEIASLKQLEEIAKSEDRDPVVSPDMYRRIKADGCRTVLAIIRKNRNGRLGRTALRFDAQRFSFAEITDDYLKGELRYDGLEDLPF
jgi:replicative DNA helicase